MYDHEQRNPYEQRPDYRPGRCASGAGPWRWRVRMHSSCVHDPDHSHHEERYLLFGVSSSGSFLVVAYTERLETIRIISALRMTSQERKAYER